MQTQAMPLATPPLPTWNPEAGYWQLAHDSVLPIFTSLHAGAHDADALLCAAFSPLVHTVLDCTLDSGAVGLQRFLRGLLRPPRPETTLRFLAPGAAWTLLAQLPPPQVAAAFDLRPGGGPELDEFPYVPVLDHRGQIPYFHRELLPLVVAILRGWGATLVVIPPPRAEEHLVQQLWATLTGVTHESA